MTVRGNQMKKIALALLLLPLFANAEILRTDALNPVLHIVNDVIYVSDNRGNDWAVVTNCEINPREIKEFTVRGKVLKSGKFVKLSEDKHCEIQSIQAA